MRKGLEDIVDRVNKTSLESYQLLNFHILRILQNRLMFPNLSQTFLRNVITATQTGKINCEQQEDEEQTNKVENHEDKMDLEDSQNTNNNQKEIRLSSSEQALKGLEKEMERVRLKLQEITNRMRKEKGEEQKEAIKKEKVPYLAEKSKLDQEWGRMKKQEDLKELQISVALWIQERKPANRALCLLPDLDGLSRFATLLSKQMETACKNHLHFGFTSRLLRYIRAKFPNHFKTTKQAWTLLFRIFPEYSNREKIKKISESANPQETATSTITKQTPKSNNKNQKRKQTNNKGVNRESDKENKEQQEPLSEQEVIAFKNWLRYFPELSILKSKDKMEHFFRCMYDMLKFMDEKQKSNSTSHKENPHSFHGKSHKFSMLPLQNGFQLKHIHMDGQAFQLAIQFMLRKYRTQQPCVKVNGQEWTSVSSKQFHLHQDAFWNKFFDIKRLETKHRKFAHFITTDGYSCSVHLTKPIQNEVISQTHKDQSSFQTTTSYSVTILTPISSKNETQRENSDLKSQPNENKIEKESKSGLCTEKKAKTDATTTTTIKTVSEKKVEKISHKDKDDDEEMNSDYHNYTYYNPELLQQDLHLYSFRRFVGCDPGRKDLVTFMDQNGKIESISNAEYRHLSCMDKHRYWINNLRKRCPGYQLTLNSIPSLLTSDPHVFLTNCMSILKYRDFLFDFATDHAFRKWKFKVKMLSDRAIQDFCYRITKGLPKEQVLIGMGDWSQDTDSGFIKGCESAPSLKLKRALLQWAISVRIIEYRTTKACYLCGSDCNEAMLPTCPRKKLKSKSKLKSQEWRDEQKQQNPKVDIQGTNHEQTKANRNAGTNDSNSTSLAACYKILCCSNNKCRIRYKHRDRNSAQNHYRLLQCILQNQDRPHYLSKQEKKEVHMDIEKASDKAEGKQKNKRKISVVVEQKEFLQAEEDENKNNLKKSKTS